MANTQKVPEGYTTVTPTMTFTDTPKAIEFYKKALGATERMRMPGPDGKIVHAELQVGNARLMMQDEMMGKRSAKSIGASPISFYLYVDDCDAAIKRAVEAGAKPVHPVADMFWGDRLGSVEDPFGYHWTISTHIKDVSDEEMRRGQDEFMRQMQTSDR